MNTVTNNPGQLNFGNPGDTVKFVGKHTMNGQALPGDRVYWFDGLTGGSGGTPAIKFVNASGFTLAGILDNANVALETCQKFTVDVTARNLRNRTGNGTHVIYHNKCTDGTIKGTFQNQLGAGVDTCIFGNDPRRVKFSGKFLNVHEAIHVFWWSFDAANPWACDFDQIEINGIERHGLEIQRCANDCHIGRVHVSNRLKNGIGLSIATGGDGGYEKTAKIVVENYVVDNTGFPIPDYSQCMGVEAMGRITVRNGHVVNGGQGIAYTFNPPGTLIDGNKFKGMTANQIVTDVPHDKAGSITGTNILNYTGAVPTAAELIGGTPQPPPPPPPPPPAIAPPKLTAYFSRVKVEALPGAKIEKRAGVGDWKPVTLDANGFDTDFDWDRGVDEIANKWKFYYIQTANGFESDEAAAQVGIDPDPVTPPTGPTETVVHGSTVDLVFPIAADGKVGQPTVKK